jgi:hypothetical protein
MSNGVCGRFGVPRYDGCGYVDMINSGILRSERTAINLIEMLWSPIGYPLRRGHRHIKSADLFMIASDVSSNV